MTLVHINAPRAVDFGIRRARCPTCDRPTRFVCFFYEWYGWGTTCLACGERWEDGEMLERPFVRGWREKSKQAARKLYRHYRLHGTPNGKL